MHNHPLTAKVLDTDVLQELDTISVEERPSKIKKYIEQKYKKSISYAQIAYEMGKRKSKVDEIQF